ncbi:oligosaccharide flippase family protein [Rubneribacter sp.]
MRSEDQREVRRGSLRANFVWNTSYQVVRMLTPIITTPYLARVLGSDALGTYSYTYTVATYFTYFCLLGLGQYGNREVAKARRNKEVLSEIFSSIFVMQFAVGLIVVLMYLGYAILISGSLMVYSLIWLIWVLAEAVDISWFYYGLEEFKTITIRNIIIRVSLILGIFAFVSSPADLDVYCLLQALSFALNSVVLWGLLKSRIWFICPVPARVLRHLKPNLVLFLPVIAVSVYTQLNAIFLGNLCGMSSVAYYDNSYKIITISLTVIQSLGTVMLPRMSVLAASGDDNEAKRYLDKSVLLSQAIAFCFMFGIIGIAPVFVPVFFGSGYDPCVLLMIIFAFMIPLCGWSNVLGVQYLIPFGKDGVYLKSVICGALINAALCVPLISYCGVYGAAFAALFAELAVTLVQIAYAKGELRIRSYIRKGIPFLCFGLIEFVVARMACVIFESAFVGLVAGVAMGGVVYAIPAFMWLKRDRVL